MGQSKDTRPLHAFCGTKGFFLGTVRVMAPKWATGTLVDGDGQMYTIRKTNYSTNISSVALQYCTFYRSGVEVAGLQTAL